jgi:hypothetical protein
MANALITGYVLNRIDYLTLILLNELEKTTLNVINKATGNDTSSFLAFNNDNLMSTLVSKKNNYNELLYKHVCDNPQTTFYNVVRKLKNVDIIGKDIGIVNKKNSDLQTNDLIAISWITDLVILPFNVNSAVFYNILNIYEKDDYFNIILHSAANSYNSEYMSFIIEKDTQSVSIKMTYGYVPNSLYYTFLIATGIIDYQPVIQKYMLNVVNYIYADDTTKCKVDNIQYLSRSVM